MWLHDRTRYLALIPAERIVEASRATEARDARVRRELAAAVLELNGLVRRYDLMVIPSMQLPPLAALFSRSASSLGLLNMSVGSCPESLTA